MWRQRIQAFLRRGGRGERKGGDAQDGGGRAMCGGGRRALGACLEIVLVVGPFSLDWYLVFVKRFLGVGILVEAVVCAFVDVS